MVTPRFRADFTPRFPDFTPRFPDFTPRFLSFLQ